MTTITKTKRTRRTPDQIVADLEAKIVQVRAREAAKEAKFAPEGKPFITAVRSVDKAIHSARDAGNDVMLNTLETVRATLGEQLVRMGVKAPVTRGIKKAEQAA